LYLQNGDTEQRRAASYRLGKSNNPTVVPALTLAFNDKDSSVQQNVIDGLYKIGTQDALDFLNSKNLKKVPVAHLSARARIIIGSLITMASMLMPLTGRFGPYAFIWSFQSNLKYSALIVYYAVFSDY